MTTCSDAERPAVVTLDVSVGERFLALDPIIGLCEASIRTRHRISWG